MCVDVHISLIGRRNLSGEIYRQLRAAMIDGRLRPGDRLPPTRELAARLSVARMTVTVAYERLTAEGFVHARVGAGTFVRDQLPVPWAPGPRSPRGVLRPRSIWDSIELPDPFERPVPFDFRLGLPDVRQFPHDAWRRLVARELRSSSVGRGVYGPAGGETELREAIVRHVGLSRGVDAAPDDVTITSGAQQGLDLLARVLLEPGDRIAVEDPGYLPARVAFQTHGVRVVDVPVDDQGLRVDALPDDARAVLTTPSHQMPLGLSMTLARRMQLLEWAERKDAAIIEDDYDSEFRYGGRPIEPLRMLDQNGRVIYLGSFSKTMLPTLRLGYVVTPPSLSRAMRIARHASDWGGAVAPQRALAAFIRDGGFARHVRRMGRIYEGRWRRIADGLAGELGEILRVVPSVVGLHICALADDDFDDQEVVRRSPGAGVAVRALSLWGHARPVRRGLILGFGAIKSEDIGEGLRRLRQVVSDVHATA